MKKQKKLVIPCYVCYDPLGHRTQDDIWYLVQHELDLYEEGEDNDIKTSSCANRARRFLVKYMPQHLKAGKT